MTNLTELTTTALLALCSLWIVCGLVLMHTAQAGLLTPGWTALLAFFALGTLAKTMAAIARQERRLQLQPQPQPVRLMLTA